MTTAARSKTGRAFSAKPSTAVREVWPENLPLFVRISSTDWTEGGWTVEDSVALARQLKPLGVDLIDCSSGGNVPDAKIPVGAGLSAAFRRESPRRSGDRDRRRSA